MPSRAHDSDALIAFEEPMKAQHPMKGATCMYSCAHFVSPVATHLERPLRDDSRAERFVPSSSKASGKTVADVKTDDALARLVALVQSNDRLTAELKRLDSLLKDARDYLAEPGCNLLLGTTQEARIRDKRSLVMTVLRSNRVAAREFLSRSAS